MEQLDKEIFRKSSNPAMKWYILTIISGKEKWIIDALQNRKVSEKMEDLFEEFVYFTVPHLTAVEISKRDRGEKYKTRERNQFPGYIFVKMVMTNEAWFMVRNTRYVTGLVGSSGLKTKPTPVSEIKMKKIWKTNVKINDDFEKGIYATPYVEGASVEVIDGPFKGSKGIIQENNDELKKAIVEILAFGKKTPTQIEHKDLLLVLG